MGKMRIIGLTGGCGTGKSTVAGLLAEKGGHIIDADKLTWELQKPGASAYEEIVKWLGTDFLLEDGSLNRRKIAELVFNDKQALRKLNNIVHTKVAEEIKSSIELIESTHDEGFIVLDVPIPVEKGFLDTADVIWVTVANNDIRVERLMARMGISEQEAMNRINSQLSNWEYESLGDVVIENEKGIEELKQKVEEALD
ncbi:MAG: dephospho-CoA kinase [Ruminococcaceae bacterium]|nr:dephospho-CoA kinase [Oscillospiraceae bacterium]